MDDCVKSLLWPLSIMKVLGLFPISNNRKRILIIGSAYLIMCTFNICTQVVQLLDFRGDIGELINIMEALSAFGFAFGVIASFMSQQHDFKELLAQTFYCLKTEDLYPKGLNKKLGGIFKMNRQFQMTFSLSVFLSIIVYILSAIIRNGLVIGAWPMQNRGKLFLLVLCVQFVTIVYEALFMLAYGTIFLACCTQIVVQFKILEHHFNRLEVSRSGMNPRAEYCFKLKTYVQHHIFVLRWTQLLSNFFSMGLTVAFVAMTPMICVQMYAMLEIKSSFAKFKYGQVCLSLLGSLAIFAIPVDFVVHEARNVARAIYHSKWYNNNFSGLAKPIGLIIQQCNNELSFKACGMIVVNSKTLLSVLKVSWSICTVMRRLKRNR